MAGHFFRSFSTLRVDYVQVIAIAMLVGVLFAVRFFVASQIRKEGMKK
jgi:hypothetical protein